MNRSNPKRLIAGDREAGVKCPHCRAEIFHGDEIGACAGCGAMHHYSCWLSNGGCGSYDCAPVRRNAGSFGKASLTITSGDLASAVPLQPARPVGSAVAIAMTPPAKGRWNRTAIVALIVAIAGIPLFGVLTGLVAIILASLALGSIHTRKQRGSIVALAGLLLGIADVVGWLVFLTVMFSRGGFLGGGPNLDINDFEPDMAAMANLPPHISRAMKANVVIETQRGWGPIRAAGLGSGVVVHVSDGEALIVTNRHVVDSGFAAGQASKDGDADKTGDLQIKLFDQFAQPGEVVWIAPDGIDLALVSTAVVGDEVQAVSWKKDPKLAVGEDVFAIGNPHGLGWTHTEGVISQFRRQRLGNRSIRIIQTSTAINPGNSGGGLYDEDGMLIGINTWTNDKRVSEGLSFAIAFESLLQLQPPPLELQAEEEPPPSRE